MDIWSRERYLVRRRLSLHPQSLTLLCFWLRSLSRWLHCARNLADKKQEMAWSHARDLERHVGESTRRKAVCVFVCLTRGGEGEEKGQGATNRHLLYVWVSLINEKGEQRPMKIPKITAKEDCSVLAVWFLWEAWGSRLGWMCCYLLHSERWADLLSSEDHGALGQHLWQLEGVEAE